MEVIGFSIKTCFFCCIKNLASLNYSTKNFRARNDQRALDLFTENRKGFENDFAFTISNIAEDNNLDDQYYIIEDLKFDKSLMNEYFYYFIYGKFYNKIGSINLANFYFCHFYKAVNLKNKADFFCKKYESPRAGCPRARRRSV